jgi:murein endopeptidase
VASLGAVLALTPALAQGPTGGLEPGATTTGPDLGTPPPSTQPIRWQHSRALGLPYRRGRLVKGVQLPPAGIDFLTWDPVLQRLPNRGSRRWATDRMIRTLLAALHAYRTAHPEAPRVLIGDLSRRKGGDFGKRYGGLGHASHQNGLDADVYYPRLDRALVAATRPAEVDLGLAQALVDAFVALDPEYAFVGPHLGLTGPRKIVRPLQFHDDHVHVRIRGDFASTRPIGEK